MISYLHFWWGILDLHDFSICVCFKNRSRQIGTGYLLTFFTQTNSSTIFAHFFVKFLSTNPFNFNPFTQIYNTNNTPLLQDSSHIEFILYYSWLILNINLDYFEILVKKFVKIKRVNNNFSSLLTCTVAQCFVGFLQSLDYVEDFRAGCPAAADKPQLPKLPVGRLLPCTKRAGHSAPS